MKNSLYSVLKEQNTMYQQELERQQEEYNHMKELLEQQNQYLNTLKEEHLLLQKMNSNSDELLSVQSDVPHEHYDMAAEYLYQKTLNRYESIHDVDQLQSLCKEYTDKIQQYYTLLQDYDTNKSSIDILNKYINTKTEKLKELREMNVSKQALIATYQYQIESMKVEQNHCQTLLTKSSHKIEELTARIQELTAQMDSSSKQSTDTKSTSLSKTLKEELYNEIAEKKLLILQLQQELEQSAVENTEFKEANTSLLDQNKQLEKKINDLQSTIDTYKLICENQKNLLEETTKNDSHDDVMSSLFEVYERNLMLSNEKCEQYEREKNDLINEYAIQLDQYENTINTLKNDYNVMITSYETLLSDHQNEFMNLYQGLLYDVHQYHDSIVHKYTSFEQRVTTLLTKLMTQWNSLSTKVISYMNGMKQSSSNQTSMEEMYAQLEHEFDAKLSQIKNEYHTDLTGYESLLHQYIHLYTVQLKDFGSLVDQKLSEYQLKYQSLKKKVLTSLNTLVEKNQLMDQSNSITIESLKEKIEQLQNDLNLQKETYEQSPSLSAYSTNPQFIHDFDLFKQDLLRQVDALLNPNPTDSAIHQSSTMPCFKDLLSLVYQSISDCKSTTDVVEYSYHLSTLEGTIDQFTAAIIKYFDQFGIHLQELEDSSLSDDSSILSVDKQEQRSYAEDFYSFCMEMKSTIKELPKVFNRVSEKDPIESQGSQLAFEANSTQPNLEDFPHYDSNNTSLNESTENAAPACYPIADTNIFIENCLEWINKLFKLIYDYHFYMTKLNLQVDANVQEQYYNGISPADLVLSNCDSTLQTLCEFYSSSAYQMFNCVSFSIKQLGDQLLAFEQLQESQHLYNQWAEKEREQEILIEQLQQENRRFKKNYITYQHKYQHIKQNYIILSHYASDYEKCKRERDNYQSRTEDLTEKVQNLEYEYQILREAYDQIAHPKTSTKCQITISNPPAIPLACVPWSDSDTFDTADAKVISDKELKVKQSLNESSKSTYSDNVLIQQSKKDSFVEDRVKSYSLCKNCNSLVDLQQEAPDSDKPKNSTSTPFFGINEMSAIENLNTHKESTENCYSDFSVYMANNPTNPLHSDYIAHDLTSQHFHDQSEDGDSLIKYSNERNKEINKIYQSGNVPSSIIIIDGYYYELLDEHDLQLDVQGIQIPTITVQKNRTYVLKQNDEELIKTSKRMNFERKINCYKEMLNIAKNEYNMLVDQIDDMTTETNPTTPLPIYLNRSHRRKQSVVDSHQCSISKDAFFKLQSDLDMADKKYKSLKKDYDYLSKAYKKEKDKYDDCYNAIKESDRAGFEELQALLKMKKEENEALERQYRDIKIQYDNAITVIESQKETIQRYQEGELSQYDLASSVALTGSSYNCSSEDGHEEDSKNEYSSSECTNESTLDNISPSLNSEDENNGVCHEDSILRDNSLVVQYDKDGKSRLVHKSPNLSTQQNVNSPSQDGLENDKSLSTPHSEVAIATKTPSNHKTTVHSSTSSHGSSSSSNKYNFRNQQFTYNELVEADALTYQRLSEILCNTIQIIDNIYSTNIYYIDLLSKKITYYENLNATESLDSEDSMRLTIPSLSSLTFSNSQRLSIHHTDTEKTIKSLESDLSVSSPTQNFISTSVYNTTKVDTYKEIKEKYQMFNTEILNIQKLYNTSYIGKNKDSATTLLSPHLQAPVDLTSIQLLLLDSFVKLVIRITKYEYEISDVMGPLMMNNSKFLSNDSYQKVFKNLCSIAPNEPSNLQLTPKLQTPRRTLFKDDEFLDTPKELKSIHLLFSNESSESMHSILDYLLLYRNFLVNITERDKCYKCNDPNNKKLLSPPLFASLDQSLSSSASDQNPTPIEAKESYSSFLDDLSTRSKIGESHSLATIDSIGEFESVSNEIDQTTTNSQSVSLSNEEDHSAQSDAEIPTSFEYHYGQFIQDQNSIEEDDLTQAKQRHFSFDSYNLIKIKIILPFCSSISINIRDDQQIGLSFEYVLNMYHFDADSFYIYYKNCIINPYILFSSLTIEKDEPFYIFV